MPTPRSDLPVLSPSSLSPALPVWRADRLADLRQDAAGARSTGFAALDAELPGGGWPAAGLTEFLQGHPGCGELQLLAPMLSASTGPLLWVAPPLQPYAPALQGLGVAPERLVIAQPERPADAAWAAEQALRAGALAAVLWWQGPEPVSAATLRRLQLAAVEGRTSLYAFRPLSVRTQSSPAPLRLTLMMLTAGRLTVDVFKRRGPPLAAPLVFDLPGPVRRRAARARPALPVESSDHALVRPAPARLAA